MFPIYKGFDTLDSNKIIKSYGMSKEQFMLLSAFYQEILIENYLNYENNQPVEEEKKILVLKKKKGDK